MKSSPFLAAALLACTAACSSSSSAEGPVIDSLEVPETTTMMTVQGTTAPGVVVTLTAHDDDSGLHAFHVVFSETGQDQTLTLPNSPTTLTNQPIQLIAPGATSGSHALSFYLEDQKGRKSSTIDKTIIVP